MPVEANTVKALFLAALEKSTPADRTAYLDEACAGKPEVRQRVEALLRVHDLPDQLLDQPAQLPIDATASPGLDFLAPPSKPGALGRLGQYDVLEVVGEGGTGIVFRAFDEKLHRVVAIKMLAPILASSGSARQRFVREARAAAAVTHDHVIGIHAVESDGPMPYLVMQFVEGRTLQAKLDSTGPLPLPEVLRIGLQVAEGLAAAHRQGLVHRDIKPANILLENGIERVKITDFGLARSADDASLTQSGMIAGTPAYMSPEQANGERVDARSDLFGLGSVLYAMCAGHPPFRAETALAVLKRVCEETPRPLRTVNPTVPEWMEALVAKLQAKNPADRFSSATEVAAVLSQRLTRLQTGDDRSDLAVPAIPSPAQPPTQAWRTRTAGLLLGAGLILAIALAGGWIIRSLWHKETGTGPETTGPSVSSPTPLPDPVIAQSRPWEPPPLPTAGELAKRPSPLDGRKRENVPPELLTLIGDGDPARAPAELVAVLGAEMQILDVAISPNGRFVATGGSDHMVRLWDLGDWPPGNTTPASRLLNGHTDLVWSVVFSPDGRFLASGSFDGTIILWEIPAGRKANELGGHSRQHSLLAFSPDSKTVAAGGDDGTLNRWDVSTGQRQQPLRLHVGIVRAVAYSRDGRLLASAGDDNTVQVVEAATGRHRQLFRGDTKRTNVAFSPDGKVLAATCDGPGPSFRTWDVENGGELSAPSGHTKHVGGLAFHPLGRLVATGSWDGTARLWDRATVWTKVLPLGSEDQVERVSVAWSPEGRYLVASRDRRGVCLLRIPALPPP